MKIYAAPTLEICVLPQEDVIRTSAEDEGLWSPFV